MGRNKFELLQFYLECFLCKFVMLHCRQIMLSVFGLFHNIGYWIKYTALNPPSNKISYPFPILVFSYWLSLQNFFNPSVKKSRLIFILFTWKMEHTQIWMKIYPGKILTQVLFQYRMSKMFILNDFITMAITNSKTEKMIYSVIIFKLSS